MKQIRPLLLLIILLFVYNYKNRKVEKEVYRSEILSVFQLSKHTYRHVSYLETEDYGKVECNGMIVSVDGESVVFDTPSDDESAKELIDWMTQTANTQIIAVIPTHYHRDNLGGLNEFHRQGIPSYALQMTIHIAEDFGLPIPQQGFDSILELTVGNEIIVANYLGEGHTCDNIIGYFPLEKIMFGGCLIKESGVGKGNLEEANTDEWSKTVQWVKEKYSDTKKVIPGHGKLGGIEYFDYTINLFENENKAAQ